MGEGADKCCSFAAFIKATVTWIAGSLGCGPKLILDISVQVLIYPTPEVFATCLVGFVSNWIPVFLGFWKYERSV